MSIVVIQKWNQPREQPAILEPAAREARPKLPEINHYTICILCGRRVTPCDCGMLSAHFHMDQVCEECEGPGKPANAD